MSEHLKAVQPRTTVVTTVVQAFRVAITWPEKATNMDALIDAEDDIIDEAVYYAYTQQKSDFPLFVARYGDNYVMSPDHSYLHGPAVIGAVQVEVTPNTMRL